MTTTTVARIVLTPRERQVLKGLADGSTLAAVALDLKIREGTAAGYLKLAKRKLHGVGENAAALAVGYAIEAITRPDLLDPEGLFLPREQRDLVPRIARGLTAAQMLTELKPRRTIDIIRRDGRELMTNLGAKNRAHTITRAWQYQILTADQVITWLR
ncbi:LuxR C-terminal-related transcriptional regulator [Streptomyces sp. NBC_01092]|uniref:LuxR C-terminal-related transcriptional regulator n=1 Tax=Streptomyces sp. NBC_01092 TaxID=2903748 RepID=UPI00386FC4CF|nr:LuxR C-terminal-related transcriptional regulator [Streptomyces sp. NBC_01092]WSU55745.1 LuxR C-terminal-related transcriptional regulator [Streptomyces sp. NBC_01092]